jgi:hypothetical protein
VELDLSVLIEDVFLRPIKQKQKIIVMILTYVKTNNVAQMEFAFLQSANIHKNVQQDFYV